MRHLRPLLAIVVSGSMAPAARAVTWEDQAERLQQVSAAQLDASPIPAPYAINFTLRAQVNAAALPKVDPTVGGKSEKVPSSPVHGIPMLQLENGTDLTATKWFSFALWAGYLPPGSEKLVGVKAKLQQTAYGGGFAITHKGATFRTYLQIFAQESNAKIVGPISSADGNDKFSVVTHLWGLALGTQVNLAGLNLWGALSSASRSADSKFYIDEDATEFKNSDYQQIGFKSGQQMVAGGIDVGPFRFGGGVSYTPLRIMIPKAIVAYSIFY